MRESVNIFRGNLKKIPPISLYLLLLVLTVTEQQMSRRYPQAFISDDFLTAVFFILESFYSYKTMKCTLKYLKHNIVLIQGVHKIIIPTRIVCGKEIVVIFGWGLVFCQRHVLKFVLLNFHFCHLTVSF